MADHPWSGGASTVGVLDLSAGVRNKVGLAPEISIRRAMPADGPALLELFDYYARLGLVLPRTPEAVYRHLREYVVAVEDGEVVGCAGLRIYNQTLAEVVGVVVAGGQQGRGIGRGVVAAVLEEAHQFGIERVFALTLQDPFFKQLGFRIVPLTDIPEKMAADRADGIDRELCKKTTMVLDLSPADQVEPGGN